MSDDPRLAPGPQDPDRDRRDRWIGAGLFFLIAPAIGLVAGGAAALNPAFGTVVAILGAVAAIYYLNRRGTQVLQGCLLAFAVTLVVAGGACIALLYAISSSLG